MTSSKSILVATIGTRDLMFQTSSGQWYNIGDDRIRDGEIIGEQLEVLGELSSSLKEDSSFRELTQYLWENIQLYQDRVKPVILGKLLKDKVNELEKIYLIVTKQKEEVKEREKDTLYAGELIKNWLENLNPNLEIKLVYLGEDGTNPSNFEAMFQWWQKVWKEIIKVEPDRSILLCLKGGVGQTSEASRISGLSLYGEQIQFYEFTQNTIQNRQGIPSDYSKPFLGTNYLWDRAQQQALKLLDRYDYAGTQEILKSYFKQDSKGWSNVPSLIKAGLAWNQGQFKSFFNLAQSCFDNQEKKQIDYYWWMAYEQAYIAVIRLEQNNTTEAMLHSFRAIEGLIVEWSEAKFDNHLKKIPNRYTRLKSSIYSQFPSLKDCFKDRNGQPLNEVNLEGWIQQRLVEAAIQKAQSSKDFKAWSSNETREQRNELSHRLGGISEKDLFKAWGQDIKDREQWEKRLLNCLNLITDNNFSSLTQASLFASVHHRVKGAIAQYQIKPFSLN